jgi:hypothetical protein
MICDTQFYWFIRNETISETQFCVFGHRVISMLTGNVLQCICGAVLNNLSLMWQYLFTTATAYRWPKIMYLTLCQNVSLLSHVLPLYFLLCENSRSWVRMACIFIPSILLPVELWWYFKSLYRNLISQFQREETQLFVLRVMVGLVILYDHVHPQGAFVKASNVDVSILVISNDILPLHVFCVEDNQFVSIWDLLKITGWISGINVQHGLDFSLETCILDVLCGASSLLFLHGLVRIKKLVVQADHSSQFNADVYNACILNYTSILWG